VNEPAATAPAAVPKNARRVCLVNFMVVPSRCDVITG
jgi:hypothetical protein